MSAIRIGAFVMSVVGVGGGCASATAGTSAATPARAAPEVAPPSDGLPTGFSVAFAAADTRARAVMFWQQCEATVVRLRAAGTFGPAARAGRQVHCERTADGVPIGGVFDTDTAFSRVLRIAMVRLDGTRPRYGAPLDTARMVAMARLERDVSRLVSAAWARQRRPLTVVPLTYDGALEAWVIPVSPQGGRTVVLGGEQAYTRGADGRVTRTLDRSARWTLFTVPASGDVALSRDDAGVSELAVARALAERGRAVSIITSAARSTLVAGQDESGARFRWEHGRRP